MKNFLVISLFWVLLTSCQETVNVNLPDYTLNLSVQSEENSNYTDIRVDPIGDIRISDLKVTHNGVALIKWFGEFDRYLYSNFYKEKANNQITVSVGNDSSHFTYNLDELIPAALDSSYIDTVITGREFIFSDQPFDLNWHSSANPDYYRLNLYWSGYKDGFFVEIDTTIVTITPSAKLPAHFALPHAFNLSLDSCWGPLPNKNEYSEANKISVNMRSCALLKQRIEGLPKCNTPFAYPCY